MKTTIVEVRDVFVAYQGAGGSVMALRGSDLTLAVGERLLVQGPNGSGKSTLLRVITGEQPVAAGTVVVSGTALHELNSSQRREWRARSVGFVDQFASRGLLPELSVVQNVALQLRLTGVLQAEAERRARATCARLEVDRLLDRPVQQLSGGEAQRVAVCAAVAHEPRLLLADEPTGELDERSAGEVYDLLARIAADGTGVILVSHDPRAVASTDRAVRIRDGRAAEQWRPGSAVVEQLPDSRGWIRVPREQHPELDPVPPLEARRTDSGLLLVPRAPAEPVSDLPSRSLPPVARPADQVLASVAGLTAGYGDRTVLDRLDLTLRTWAWTAITGPSGAGKSTLISALSGLLPTRAGTVTVGDGQWDGRSRGARAEHRCRWVALLPQRPVMLEALTVRENLQLTAGIRGPAVAPSDPAVANSADLGRVIEELADRLALTRLLDQPVQLLSGGERQRAALARALISSAPLLLLDEPTSQQDDSSVDRVIQVLTEETAAGRSVLTASHDSRVLSAATIVLELDQGRIRVGPRPTAAATS
jgi:peptide/nickel transport system ATP-binding protein/energy-coupling factor transport system ATP-binding protein